MRVRLCIQRHELPPVKILWQVPHESTPVSKLLDQVSELIPLESDGWGCEDYTVLVGDYECLHYLDANSVLKEDDEVTIRALQTSDVRIRTVSGRHQISAAGAHLIDGIAFGRQYLRRPDRPPIRIPPRKRQRISYCDTHDQDEDEVEESFENEPPLLRITEPDQHYVEGTGAEHYRKAGRDEPDSEAGEQLEVGTLRSGKRRRKSVTFNESSIAPAGPSFDVFEDQDEEEYEDDEDGQEFQPSESDSSDDNEVSEGERVPLSPIVLEKRKDTSRRTHEEAPKSATKKPEESPKSATNKPTCSPAPASDSGTPSSSSSTSESEDSDDEAAISTPKPPTSVDNRRSSQSSTTSSSSESDSNSDNSSDSDSSSDSKNEPQEQNSKLSSIPTPNQSATLEKSVAAPKQASLQEGTPRTTQEQGSPLSLIPQAASDNSTKLGNWIPAIQTPPGEGTIRTMSRNQRRRILRQKNLLIRRQAPAASDSESAQRQHPSLDTTATANTNGHADVPEEPAQEDHTVKSQTDGSAESRVLSQASPAEDTQPSHKALRVVPAAMTLVASAEPSFAVMSEVLPKGSQKRKASIFAPEETQTTIAGSAIEDSTTDPPSKRARLDVETARRLLFGSLGKRAPKNKEDEEKLRARLEKEALMATSGPSKVPQQAEKSPDASNKPVSNDPNRWKSKIKLRAVETVGEPIEYSAPPFPFVQRWDPLQKQKRGKKRKRGLAAAAEQEYVEEDTSLFENYDDVYEGYPDNSQHDQLKDASYAQTDGENGAWLDYDGTAKEGAAVPEDSGQASQPESSVEEDLLQLPDDINTLPDLKLSTVASNSIITFKRLECSAATSYQPTITSYQTALVITVDEDWLELKLARRDRVVSRILGNDEAAKVKRRKKEREPVVDSSFDIADDNSDSGYLSISYAELIEPKLVSAASEPIISGVVIQDSVVPAASAAVEEEVVQDSMFTNEDIADADLIASSSNSDPAAASSAGHGSAGTQSQDAELPFVDAEEQAGSTAVGVLETVE